ncbi:MAG TPA: peptidase M23, partial [Psychromonas sp.]
MPFLLRLKARFLAFIAFVNNLPRKHFFALILLFLFLLVISFIPMQPKTQKTIQRSLELPKRVITTGERASAEPLTAVKEEYAKVFPDLSGNRQVEFEIKAGDTLSDIFQKQSLSPAALQI